MKVDLGNHCEIEEELEKKRRRFELMNRILTTFYASHEWRKLPSGSREEIYFSDRVSSFEAKVCTDALGLTLTSIKLLWQFERHFNLG
jgi:hypothetical protein